LCLCALCVLSVCSLCALCVCVRVVLSVCSLCVRLLLCLSIYPSIVDHRRWSATGSSGYSTPNARRSPARGSSDEEHRSPSAASAAQQQPGGERSAGAAGAMRRASVVTVGIARKQRSKKLADKMYAAAHKQAHAHAESTQRAHREHTGTTRTHTTQNYEEPISHVPQRQPAHRHPGRWIDSRQAAQAHDHHKDYEETKDPVCLHMPDRPDLTGSSAHDNAQHDLKGAYRRCRSEAE
jgi:hypothetical protein